MASKKTKRKPKQPVDTNRPASKPRSKAPKRTRPKPIDAVVQALLGVLERRKQADPNSYAWPLVDLLEEAEQPRAAAVAIAKAPSSRKQLTITVPAKATAAAAEGALVGFVADSKNVLGDPRALISLLQAVHTPSNQLFTVAALAMKLPHANRPTFRLHWNEAVEQGHLPLGVGALRSKGAKLFLWSDVVPSVGAGTTPEVGPSTYEVPLQPSVPVRERLLEAFDELDVQGGRRNYVTLFDLRRRLPDVERDGFDAAVNELRREWILTLDPAEGRHERLPEEVLAAGIIDQSSLLVYAARRDQ